MLELIWEPDAADQLDRILDYIAAHSLRGAERVDALIHDRIELARKFPEIGRPGRVAGTRELVTHPNYVVIYQIAGSAIDIIRVLHARQRYP